MNIAACEVVRLEEYFRANPMKGAPFNHYRPARYLAENVAPLKGLLSAATLDRWEAAFTALNELLR